MPNPRMPKKGERGAARNYITRTQAIKKLQCSLADFRRLCILKGIYPREPRNKKKANKGSTAPTSFYYIKDIQYLLHEPVLEKLRQHKAFAKKLSRALGRGEYGLAKNLDQNKPEYRLDHIIKERYPTFQDSLRDLDDALSLIVLFAHLPSTSTVPAQVIQNCSRLYAEWQLYVLRTKSLKKVFLSIKGIYYQAQVRGVPITWLVPYQFTQHVPSDIDFRIMLTFLELYQTMLGFVFYRLYADVNLIYPPKADASKDDEAAGIGALLLQETSQSLLADETNGPDQPLKKVTAKEVKKQIKSITAASESNAQPEGQASNQLASIASLEADEAVGTLFEDYYFYLSREVTRPFLEFIIRSFQGKVGWDSSLGAGSPFTETDARITHHIVDRPLPTDSTALAELIHQRTSLPGKRVFIQPQWVVDCINEQTIKSTGPYGPGEVLPPHLSPFVDARTVREQGGYVPQEAMNGSIELPNDEEEQVEEEQVIEDEDVKFQSDEEYEESDFKADAESAASIKLLEVPPALLASALNPASDTLRHAAELEAESRQVPHSVFEKELQSTVKKVKTRGLKRSAPTKDTEEEEDLANIMITGKKRKQFDSLQRKKQKKLEEKQKLEKKRQSLLKRKA